jgi:hypothetical protein
MMQGTVPLRFDGYSRGLMQYLHTFSSMLTVYLRAESPLPGERVPHTQCKRLTITPVLEAMPVFKCSDDHRK